MRSAAESWTASYDLGQKTNKSAVRKEECVYTNMTS
jgi:hypothetical protein